MAAETTTLEASTDTQTEAEEKPGSLLDAGKVPEPKPDAQAEGEKKGADPLKAEEAKATDTKPVVPETYADPKLPEGVQFAPEVKTKVDTWAKGLNLTQEQYQQAIDMHAEINGAQQKAVTEKMQSQIQEWESETKTQLGANYKEALAVAVKGIDAVFTDPKENKSFREMMSRDVTGLGNWAPMVKLCAFVGKLVSEGKLVEGRPDSTKPEKSDEEVIFDHPTSKPR